MEEREHRNKKLRRIFGPSNIPRQSWFHVIFSRCFRLLFLLSLARLPYTVPLSRSCFEFLGFAAHITFISVQKPHHNCYLSFFIPSFTTFYRLPVILGLGVAPRSHSSTQLCYSLTKRKETHLTYTFRSRQHCLVCSLLHHVPRFFIETWSGKLYIYMI